MFDLFFSGNPLLHLVPKVTNLNHKVLLKLLPCVSIIKNQFHNNLIFWLQFSNFNFLVIFIKFTNEVIEIFLTTSRIFSWKVTIITRFRIRWSGEQRSCKIWVCSTRTFSFKVQIFGWLAQLFLEILGWLLSFTTIINDQLFRCGSYFLQYNMQ